jgi:hypothetical protein
VSITFSLQVQGESPFEFFEAPSDVLGAFDVDPTMDEDGTSDVLVEVVEGGVTTVLFAHRFILMRRCPAFQRILELIPKGMCVFSFVLLWSNAKKKKVSSF